MPYKDKKRRKEYSRKYHKKNREKILKQHREYYRENERKIIEYGREYRRENKDKISKQKREYYQENRETIIEHHKKWDRTHKEQHRKYNRKRKKNPKYKLSDDISASIRQSLKNNKNGHHWENLVGYTLDDLMGHLEKQFTKEMSWDNRGSFWHIDHIIPISAFNFNNYNQLDFKRCWALKNLRPLEATENRRKHNKINKPFQPNLRI